MSRLTEYLSESIGYDSNGLPASTVQFTFGLTPFQVAETEDIADVTEITAVVQSDVVVDLKIIDNMVMVSFDFSNDVQTFAEFAQELEMYKQQSEHVTSSLNRLMNDLALAERNEVEIENIRSQAYLNNALERESRLKSDFQEIVNSYEIPNRQKVLRNLDAQYQEILSAAYRNNKEGAEGIVEEPEPNIPLDIASWGLIPA